jgi:O-antigen ligase
VLPALAFSFGGRRGQIVFVLYREPKLIAVQILVCSLLVALAWSRLRKVPLATLGAGALRPPWLWLSLFSAYGLITIAWVAVPQNLLFELSQYALLLLLLLVLEVWSDVDAVVPKIVLWGIVLSFGVATLTGLVQGAYPISLLSPIDPGSGVSNPSFMGYKNPMALFLLGQIFLVAYLAVSRPAGRRRRLLGLLLAVELVYLISLQSRTSYAALAGASVFLAVLPAVRSGRRALRAALAIAAAVGLLTAAGLADAGARQRIRSLLAYVAHPASYLESDRGTYLLNSLNMVRCHPWGIGLGDWQTQYPVYRLHHRYVYFSETEQVNKAHSDHIEIFAETGWPGLFLWLGFWAALLLPLARLYFRCGDLRALFLATQLTAFGLAMAGDHIVEHPYGKLEFLLVAFLAHRSAVGGLPEPTEEVSRRRTSPILLWGVTALAVVVIAYSVLQARKVYLAAAIAAMYFEAMDRGGEVRLLQEVSRLGKSFTRLPGYGKDLCNDYLILADAEIALGHRAQALRYTRDSLRLSPYSTSAMRRMAVLETRRASYWNRSANFILHEATRGFAAPR